MTDVSIPVEIPVGRSTTTLTVLVVNGSVAQDVATVTFGRMFPRLSLGNSTYTFLCTSGICALSCGMKDGDPVWSWPLTWTGNTFVSETSLTRVIGEMSADRRTLLSF